MNLAAHDETDQGDVVDGIIDEMLRKDIASRPKYYAIVGGAAGQVIGYCTSESLNDVAEEEPRATLREVTKQEYMEAWKR